MRLRMRHIEGAAQGVAELVMKRHACRTKDSSGKPATI
jgi:hypothetical protein